ncbi:MAG: hypothetical protein LC687_00155 [Actinobacteria bacterium]|nr:hypothetical protein [Actinomycetota bacterium]MCA1806282.1 hypothetical protein [Actinomycetota bacterium]
MKTRKFEIEWQLFKTFFKVRMPAKTPEAMQEKMDVAVDVFVYFYTERSKELAYNVLNWLQGLSIALKKDDPRRELIEDTLIELGRIFEDGEGGYQPAAEKEPDESFSREAMEEYIGGGFKSSPIYTDHIGTSFDFDLLIANLNQNLDMQTKWAKGDYIHKTLMGYLFNAIDIILSNEYAEVPDKVYNKYKKVVDRATEIDKDPDSKVTHKFLY